MRIQSEIQARVDKNNQMLEIQNSFIKEIAKTGGAQAESTFI